MEKINFSNLASWCAVHGYHLEDWIPSLTKSIQRVQIAPPNGPQALAELVDDLISLEGAETERLFWLRDWTIWNERSQEIGLQHLRLLVDSTTSGMREIKGHIYVLQPCEWREAVALLIVPILYGWDAHLLFGSGAALVDVSHEGRVAVSFRSKDGADAARIQAWQPQKGAGANG
ncbi:hypothetical protein [uncultured Paludibaculum sp.]|uniref:hypothetical protein n=1 Tax=uncultured Paludibaculum sp. TaxID=1765020 RepID=UPI002AAAA2E6|nr:hypothetical protein [uncultured Paludibaculum sp.]